MRFLRIKEFRCPNFFICLSLSIEVIDQPKKVPKKSGAQGFFGSGGKLTLVDGIAILAQKMWEIQKFFFAQFTFYLGAIDGYSKDFLSNQPPRSWSLPCLRPQIALIQP